MDWIEENVGVFILICIVIVFIVLAIAIISLAISIKIKRSITTSALYITAGLNYDSDNLGESLVITIFNNNYRDIVLHDFGFIYKNQNISFIEEYTERKVGKGRPCVPARASLSYKVNPERIEKFVVAHNFNAKSVDKIRLYVSDSVGNKVVTKDKSLTKIFDKRQDARIKLAKIKIHEESVKDYMSTHEGSRPFSDRIWSLFHKKYVTIPKLIKKSAEFIDDKTITPENTTKSNYNPAPIQSSDPEVEVEEAPTIEEEPKAKTRTDTRDMKVTFIDLDVPLKGKNLDSKEKKK